MPALAAPSAIAGTHRDGRAGHANHERVAAGARASGSRCRRRRRRNGAASCERRSAAPAARWEIARRSIASWSRAPSTSLTPRPLRRASSPAPAPTFTPRCWRPCARSRDRSMAARAIESNRCSRELDAGTRLERMLDGVQRQVHPLPPGFGHAIYPDGDPRAALLKKVAPRLRAIARAADCSRPRSTSRRRSGSASGCVPISIFI